MKKLWRQFWALTSGVNEDRLDKVFDLSLGPPTWVESLLVIGIIVGIGPGLCIGRILLGVSILLVPFAERVDPGFLPVGGLTAFLLIVLGRLHRLTALLGIAIAATVMAQAQHILCIGIIAGSLLYLVSGPGLWRLGLEDFRKIRVVGADVNGGLILDVPRTPATGDGDQTSEGRPRRG